MSLSQLCGVRKKKPPSQSPSSGQCAPHSFGVESLLPRRGHSIDAYLNRGAAMMPPTASQRRPVMVSRCLRLVRLWKSLRRLPHAGDNHQRVVRHVSQVVGGEPVHILSTAFRYVLLRRPSTRSLGWSEEKLCTTSEAGTSLALRSSWNPACCHGHHSMDVDDVQCDMARQ